MAYRTVLTDTQADHRILNIRHPSRVFCMLNFQSSPRLFTNWIAAILALSAFLNSCRNKLSPIAIDSNGYWVRSRNAGAPSTALSNTYITFSRYLRRVDRRFQGLRSLRWPMPAAGPPSLQFSQLMTIPSSGSPQRMRSALDCLRLRPRNFSSPQRRSQVYRNLVPCCSKE